MNDLDSASDPSSQAEAIQNTGKPHLARSMRSFSNFAISLSTICILAGGVSSFHVAFCTVGGAAIGIGWPFGCLFALIVAATMAQLASAFPLAGGPYQWASILGGKGWGWATACFNLLGLITVLAAINVGVYQIVLSFTSALFQYDPQSVHPLVPAAALVLMFVSQALINHFGIGLTSRLTDLSGYLIIAVALLLTVAMLGYRWIGGYGFDLGRLISFENYSGPAGDDVWPASGSLVWLFLLGLLLPAYTVTGFDASAQTAEETIDPALNVPRGIVRAVLVSGVAGWIMLVAVVLAIPDMATAAGKGEQAFFWILREVVPEPLLTILYVGIIVAQYLCGLATLTAASRSTFAFARDGGLPFSRMLSVVQANTRAPAAAIWAAAGVSILFAVFVPYTAIAAVCVILLNVSYVVPTALGLAGQGRSWTRMGPWHLGPWFRPLAVLAVFGCGVLVLIGVQPPNEIAVWIVGGFVAVLTGLWFGNVRHRFRGPPPAILHLLRQTSNSP
jgi:amino acid transporter